MKYRTFLLLLASLSASALADDAQFNYSLSRIRSTEFNLDSGGEAKTDWWLGNVGIKKKLDPQNSLGLDISAGLQHWDFKNQQAWGGKTPWQTLERAAFELNYTYATPTGWIYSFSPGLEYSAEKDAERSDSLNYGGSGFIAKSISPDLLLGLGLAAYSGLNEASVFPFLIVNWQITPQLRLSNPFSAGPVGPAGLELSWSATSQLELATGGTMRSYSSRLAKNNPVASGGVLEQTSVPIYLRAGYRFNSAFRIDTYLGSAVGGEMLIYDQHGHEVSKEKHDPMPFLAVSFSGEF